MRPMTMLMSISMVLTLGTAAYAKPVCKDVDECTKLKREIQTSDRTEKDVCPNEDACGKLMARVDAQLKVLSNRQNKKAATASDEAWECNAFCGCWGKDEKCGDIHAEIFRDFQTTYYQGACAQEDGRVYKTLYEPLVWKSVAGRGADIDGAIKNAIAVCVSPRNLEPNSKAEIEFHRAVRFFGTVKVSTETVPCPSPGNLLLEINSFPDRDTWRKHCRKISP